MSTEALTLPNPVREETAGPHLADLPRLPRKFGRYKLFDFVGKGGMAEIFLARAETELGGARLCVVKEIIPQFADHPQFAEMLIFEAKLAARLNHAHIVQVFDLGRADGRLFIAMEYVEGLDLNALLRRCSQTKVALPVEFALGIVAAVLGALDYAHRRADDNGNPLGIVHRDVSPSNVLISLEGEVKLCDFGIAHANALVISNTPHLDEAIKGKAGYMSPEQARGDALDARADVFAAGIVLWELLSGRRLYRVEGGRVDGGRVDGGRVEGGRVEGGRVEGGRLTLIEQARQSDIKPIPERGLPHEETLRALVAKALSPRREDRFSSAGAMLRALEGYMAEAKMAPSPLKLGEWLVDRFGTATVQQRRARERALTESERPRLPVESVSPISPLATSDPRIAAPEPHSLARPESGIVRTARIVKEQAIETPPPSLVAAIVDVGPPSDDADRRAIARAPSPRAKLARVVLMLVVFLIMMIAWFISRHH